MAMPLLLAARELARGPTAALPDNFEVAATAASSAHLAVLFRSRTGRNCVRLGVFKTDDQVDAESSELVDLLPESDDSEAPAANDCVWTLAWSPDRKFLVVSGRIARAEGESEGVLWLFARPEWLASTAASEASTGPPLLLRVDPTKYLTAKHWEPSASIVSVFFPTQSGSNVFVLSGDGVWLRVGVQLAKLALVAMDRTAAEDTAGLFTMKVVKKLAEWHAGVTAASFEPESATLVVTGGVRDPSAALVETQASSLSVWRVASDKDSKEVAELLDFTMVEKGKQEELDDEASEEEEEEDVDDTDTEEGGGLLTGVKSALFAPFRMMVGAETTESEAIRGSIRYLALSPNGNFVSMVDDLGRIAVRQIDTCADVLKWQGVSSDVVVKLAVWLTSDVVALVLTNNTTVYSRFIAHSEEGAASGPTTGSIDSENEDVPLSEPSGRLVPIPARHYRPSTSGIIETIALTANDQSSSEKHSASFCACEVIVSGNSWCASLVQNLPVEPFIDLLMDAQRFDDALATVALYDTNESTINADCIHRRVWMQYRNQAGSTKQDIDDDSASTDSELLDLEFLSTRPRGLLQRGERDEFRDALDHLRAISHKQWVIGECLHLIADDSSGNMKKILDVAWDAWVSLNDGNEVALELSQEKVDLQRYMYRLETLRLVLCEEEGVSTTSVAGDQLFDGEAYARFRSRSLLTTAKQFAREGRVDALKVLLGRHAWNLLPHWFDVLELLPPFVSPFTYGSLLPAIATQIEDDGQICTLCHFDGLTVEAGDDNELVTPVMLLPENELQDLTDEERAEFEEYSNMNRNERSSLYGEWLMKRILELDARYGQLAFAYELSSLATKCLSGWSSQEAKKPLEEFFLHTERLYKCVYPLHLSACCLLPLSEWCALSIRDQAMIVVGSDEKEFAGDVSHILDRLDTVFVSQRRDRTYALDDLDHVLEGLIVVIRTKLDSVTGYSEDANSNATHEAALGCIGIARQLLSLPVWEKGDRAESGARQQYEEALALETDMAHACELLDLLTYGAVKLSPAKLRSSTEEQEESNAQLDAVCQVFVSNPSNYKPSVRAREWLEQHHVCEANLAEGKSTADLWNEPLAAIMYLAKLLRVDSQKLDIWMKGAYAALYCMDYDVAYDLTMQVIAGLPSETDALAASQSNSGDKLTLLHLVSLILDLVSASSFRSWSKKRKLCCALFSAANVASSDLFAHQVTNLVLSWQEKIEAIQALMVELGLSDDDLEQRRLAGSRVTSSADAVLLNELRVVVELLHEEKNDRQFLLRLLQRGFQLAQVMSNNNDTESENEDTEAASTFLQQMAQLCVKEALELTSVPTKSDSGDWQQYLELGFSYLVLWSDLCKDDERFEAFCCDDILSPIFVEQPVSDAQPTNDASEVVVRRLHHLFLFQLAQAKEDTVESDADVLLNRRKRLETLSSSYEAVRKTTSSLQNGASGDLASPTQSRLIMSEQRLQIYSKLAQQCQERLVSQKKSQELEQMNTFFNTELDLERFAQDEGYRNDKIMVLATKKEHFQLSRQFASKYGIDEYDCVLAYIKNVLLCPPDSSRLGRREQLDQAFRIEQIDILEEALQKPTAFGDFLLGKGATGEPSVYEMIDGTDHVGILLVLRMVLECSKRIYQEPAESESPPRARSAFPLSKPSTDRVTLLFMCLKKLKEIGDVLDDMEPVDLKLIGAASTTTELLTPLASSHTDPQAMIANREVAVEAVRPLLTGKTIKFVTKILRKLHRVTPSSMVMIYINDLLTGIWREHGATGSSTGALSADLAVYAYESCVPCLSVLSNEHLMLFHYLFLDGSSDKPTPELVAHLNIEEEFYGQSLNALEHFGALLTPQKRVELVADTLTLFQTKYNSWQNSGPRSNVSSASSTSSSSSVSWDPAQFKRKEQELHYLERELAENVCYLLLKEIEQSDLTFDADGAQSKTARPLEALASSLKTWFAMDPLQQVANEEVLQSTVLMELCQCVMSVDLATLIMELVLRAGGSKASGDVAVNAIARSYQAAIANLVARAMGNGAKQTVPWVERLVWTWVTDSAAPSSNQAAGLECYLRVTLCSPGDGKTSSRVIYEPVVTMLSQSPSTLLKEIGLNRLRTMQTPADEDEVKSVSVMVREAVLSQWEQLIAFSEEQEKWTEAAVLSHLLATCESDQSTDATTTKWHFGLHVKAVWSALLTKHKLDENPDSQRILVVPSRDISDHFAAVFEELLAFIEVCSSDDNPKALRFAEMATVALSNLLVRHDDVLGGSEGTAQRSASAWQDEQQRAVQARVEAQFQVGSVAERQALPPNEEDATCWAALFARGVWGARLLSWYTTHAYAELSGEEEATEAVILVHWEANNLDLAIQLLLMSPFDGLREKYAERALSVVRQLPRGSRSWFAAMELALLRFDIAVLLQHGLHSPVVAFLLQNPSRKPALWTSSGDYVVCALVTQGELAAAGRLTCALRHTHPLLWDVENARLLLANYLRSLASSPVQHKSHDVMQLARLKHDVYVQTSSRFASVLL
ncbi:hypothetical protein PR001_g6731 [Phytophthora rubi]|uniref:Sec39 domain-containing protein n=1 Tax=Phytophthora rubi TaxID=129364 RepID=A0A6A3N733_9STRA|nr:hypothetical protein PR001_g6731 [Phytophthora rubi]